MGPYVIIKVNMVTADESSSIVHDEQDSYALYWYLAISCSAGGGIGTRRLGGQQPEREFPF